MQLRQPSNPFENISERALELAITNALKAMYPDLDSEGPVIPALAKDVGGGFVLLRAKEVHVMDPLVATALLDYTKSLGRHMNFSDDINVERWARLRLPNLQIAHSHWKESLRPAEKVRRARMVKASVFTHSTLLFPDMI
jgi:hypothetical protein